MTIPTRDTTLLVLLLALNKVQEPESESEQKFLWSRLFEVGEQLELDPDDWEYIYEGLIYIVTKHPPLNSLFEKIDTHIQGLDNQTFHNLLPTEEEILQVFERLKRSIPIEIRGDDEQANLDIIQIAIMILKSPNPSKLTKQSDWVNRITLEILPHLEL
jgi:hypothetical protein